MKRSVVEALTVTSIVILAVIGISFLMYVPEIFHKSFTHPFLARSEEYSIDPFVNSSGVMFTVNLTLSDFSGGSLVFYPTIAVKSVYLPATPQENNTILQLSIDTNYSVLFYPVVVATPLDNTPGAGHYELLNSNTTSFVAAGPVLLWTAGKYWDVPMTSLSLSRGTYGITYQLMFVSIEPSQNTLNVTSASSVVNLAAFSLTSTTTLAGRISVSGLAASAG